MISYTTQRCCVEKEWEALCGNYPTAGASGRVGCPSAGDVTSGQRITTPLDSASADAVVISLFGKMGFTHEMEDERDLEDGFFSGTEGGLDNEAGWLHAPFKE